MITINDAREFLHSLQDEYQHKVTESPDDAERYDLAEECLDGIADPLLEFYLLWSSGSMGTAMEAAHEEILECIRSTNRNYAY